MLVYRQNRHRKTSMFCMGPARLSLEEDFLGSADAALALEGPRSTALSSSQSPMLSLV